MPQGAQPQASPEPPANFKLGQLIDLSNSKVVLNPGPGIQVEAVYFKKLLAQSISLSKQEKLKIINSFSNLNQFQINELIRIFQDEEQE